MTGNMLSLASDSEVLKAIHDLQGQNALNTISLSTQTNVSDLQSTQMNKSLQDQLQQIRQQVDGTIPGPSLENTSLNLQNNLQQLIKDSTEQLESKAKQITATAAETSIDASEESSVDRKALQDKGTQKVINEAKENLEETLGSEADMKLVQDLKTISVALENKKNEKQKNVAATAELTAAVTTADQKSSNINKEELLKSATQTLDGLLNKPKEKDIQALQQQINQLEQIKVLEEQAKDLKKQELIKNAEAALKGLQDLQKSEKTKTKPTVVVEPPTPAPTPQVSHEIDTIASNAAVIQAVAAANLKQAVQELTPQKSAQLTQIDQTVKAINDLKVQVIRNQSLPVQPTSTVSKNVEFIDKIQAKTIPEITKMNKLLDFLSTTGKLSVFMLAITPLPTFIGVWNKPKQEQIQRVESVSYSYLLLNILCNSVWCSYAFKTQNIDLAIISVFPLVIAIILSTVYLSVKPESTLIKQFFGTVLICQIFNFDMLPMPVCGLLGTLSSISINLIPLIFIPDVIQTRDVSGINYALTVVSVINYFIWAAYALIKMDPFMSISQGLGLIFNLIQLMFFYWAKQMITSKETPLLMFCMRGLLWFFNLFAVQKTQKEMQKFFWHDETTEIAKAHIKQYKDGIMKLQQKYADQENISYDDHMSIRSEIDRRLSDTYKDHKSQILKKDSSEASTQGSSQNKADLEANWDQEQANFQNNIQNDDMLSINSFNSSMNFAKLQNSINARNTASNLSESTNYYKSRIEKMEKATLGGYNETLILDDIPNLTKMDINPVKEVDQEDEQSEWNDHRDQQQDNEQPRFSTESLINIMSGDVEQEMRQGKNQTPPQHNDDSYSGDNEDDVPTKQKLDLLRQKAQKLKLQKKLKKEKEWKLKQSQQSIQLDQLTPEESIEQDHQNASLYQQKDMSGEALINQSNVTDSTNSEHFELNKSKSSGANHDMISLKNLE